MDQSFLLYARGAWQGTLSALDGSVARFSRDHQEVVFGQLCWRFGGICFANENYTTELTDGGGRIVSAGLSTEWGFTGRPDFDRFPIRTGRPARPHANDPGEESDPAFQGWPAGWLRARERAGGFAVELFYQDVHPDEMKGYLQQLRDWLMNDGLKLEAPEEAPAGGESKSGEQLRIEQAAPPVKQRGKAGRPADKIDALMR